MTRPDGTASAAPAGSPSLHELLARATSLHQAGRRAEAERAYRDALAVHPGDPVANHNLGVLFMQAGMPVANAIPHFRAAWEADPSNATHGMSLLRALVAAGDLVAAGQLHAEGLRRGHRWPAVAAMADRGGAGAAPAADARVQARVPQEEFRRLAQLFSAGDFAAAEARARSLAQRFPGDGIAWKALGMAAAQRGQRDDALGFMRTAARLLPGDAETHANLGRLQREVGLLGEAEASLRRSCALQPDRPDTRVDLGEILLQLGNAASAEASFRQALALRADSVGALCGLARARAAGGEAGEAEALFRRALAAQPAHAPSLAGLGALLFAQRRLGEAEELCRGALAIAPDDFETTFALGTLLVEQARFDEAEIAYRKAVSLRPGDLPSRSSLVCAMNYNVRESPERLLEEARAFGELARARAKAPFADWRCVREPDRLRVGLVSGDLRSHPVGFAIEGAIAAAAAGRIDWVGYPTYAESDELTARLRKACAGWRPLVGLEDEAAARAIHDDAIHVLVDLSGHTANNRLPVFAWCPAPVQATWLGYFATTGLAEMDYALVDPVSAPPELAARFTERLWYLPETRLCFTPPATPLAPAPLPALANGFVTFGSFQNPRKITDAALEAWNSVLRRCERSRLRLQGASFAHTQFASQFRARLERAGLDIARVDLAGSVPRDEYFATFARVDIVLDTFPYPGATTTCEALWMGVPTLTLSGPTMTERQGASLLAATGLAEWVAGTREEYVEKAVRLASDLPRLASLRAGLRDRVRGSAVFDVSRFARELEEALWGMWRERGAGK